MVLNKSSKRTCITCTTKGINKEQITLSSKKKGLYSTLPKILNCTDKYNPTKGELEEEVPEIVGSKLDVSLEIKETSRWIFYWAAGAGSSIEGDKPEEAATSYGNESNHGVTKSDKDGNATLVLNCPKLYKEEGTLYPRHVHYTVLTEDDVWSTTIGTVEVMCKIPYDIMKKIIGKGTYLVMDALSKEAYDKQHIPNSILCHHESLQGMTKQKKDGVIKQLIKEHSSDFPKIKEFIDSTESIKEVPIITYCAHEESESSSKLSEHLYSCGYYNVMEYPGGIKEWFTETKDTELFEGILSEEEAVDDEDDEDDEGEDDDEEYSDGDYTKLSDEEEKIIYEGVAYIHRLDTDEILTVEDMEVIGTYDGEDIEWNSSREYKHHLKRIKEKGGKPITDGDDDKGEDEEEDAEEEDEEEADAEEEDEEEADEEEADEEEADDNKKTIDTQESSDDSDSSDEESNIYSEEMLHSKKVSELKELLDKLKEKSVTGKKQEMIDCLMKCKPVFKGGGHNDTIMYGGAMSQSTFNQQFRGWGFTFLR